jgi:hypothetical protein
LIYSWWANDAYPILINPTFEEIQKLSTWDTVRICVDNGNIGLASGLGNTHDSITKMMIAHGYSKGLPETYILFKVDEKYYFNLEDVSGERQAPARRTIRQYFTDGHGDILRQVIEARESL